MAHVVAAFGSRTQAEQAAHELVQAGFQHEMIRFAGHGASTGAGGLLEKVKSLFTGQEMSASGLYNELMGMGTPSEDARYFQSEYEAGHPIVAVDAGGRGQEAIDILNRNGGAGVGQRPGINIPPPDLGGPQPTP